MFPKVYRNKKTAIGQRGGCGGPEGAGWGAGAVVEAGSSHGDPWTLQLKASSPEATFPNIPSASEVTLQIPQLPHSCSHCCVSLPHRDKENGKQETPYGETVQLFTESCWSPMGNLVSTRPDQPAPSPLVSTSPLCEEAGERFTELTGKLAIVSFLSSDVLGLYLSSCHFEMPPFSI